VDAPETTLRESPEDAAALRLQVRTLQERLAFYEGFDRLIQENVAHARELFRRAVIEQEAAAEAANRVQFESGRRETALREELAAIAADVSALAEAVDALGRRVAAALGDQPNGRAAAPSSPLATAVVVHGVPSARSALSLQRFVASLTQVSDVAAREFAGGVLRLDVQTREPLRIAQFGEWTEPGRFEPLTERPDVIELALQPDDREQVVV
jgi:hypothetical protein